MLPLVLGMRERRDVLLDAYDIDRNAVCISRKYSRLGRTSVCQDVMRPDRECAGPSTLRFPAIHGAPAGVLLC